MSYLKTVFKTLKTESPILYTIVLLHFGCALFAIGTLIIDDRTLMGVNVWIKPIKFFISTGIYIATVGYLITFYPYSNRKKNFIRNIVSFSLVLEVGIIVYQAARGVQSHYNISTQSDALLFSMMGFFIGINVIIMVLFVIDTIRLKLKTSKSVQWAILLGWVVVVLASWIGGQMISQMAHNVGVADGGAGLPLVNWSTTGGDLRIAHFFGLHSIQIIPLFAVLISTKWKASSGKQILAVTIFSLLFATLVGFTFYQAKQGMPLMNL